MSLNEMTAQTLQEKLFAKEDICILDVREKHEWNAHKISEMLIPLAELSQRVNEIPKNKPIVVYCHSGVRSLAAVEYLKSVGFKEVKNLIGGILAWEALSKVN